MEPVLTNDRPGALVAFPREREPMALVFALAVNDHMQAVQRKEQVWIRPEKLYGGAPNGHAPVTVLK